MGMTPEYFPYTCPHCASVRNAADVAKELPDEVFRTVIARRNAQLRKTRSAAGGRPALTRCPGCDIKMAAADLRSHRLPCIKERLEALKFKGHRARLSPKYPPDPHPNFSIESVHEEVVVFKKLSSGHHLTVEFQKIAEITDDSESLVHIRLLGSVSWNDVLNTWQFQPTVLGRPSLSGARE